MRKLVLFILLLAFLAILATCSMSEVDKSNTTTPTVKMVNAIVAQPTEAAFTSTPQPTSTPTETATPTLQPVNAMVAGTDETTVTATATPTETANPAIPAGWTVYTNEKYGFEFAHPNLYDCKGCGIGAFINLGDIQSVTTLAVESTITPNDAPFDGLSINVFLNPNAIPLEDFIEQEKQAILAGPGLIGPPLGETPYTVGGQTGVEMSLTGNISSAIYIPFPHSHKIMIVSIGEQHAGSFIETAKQILSTLRFTK